MHDYDNQKLPNTGSINTDSARVGDDSFDKREAARQLSRDQTRQQQVAGSSSGAFAMGAGAAMNECSGARITPQTFLRIRANELRNEAAAMDRLADALPAVMDYPAELALTRIIEKSLR